MESNPDPFCESLVMPFVMPFVMPLVVRYRAQALRPIVCLECIVTVSFVTIAPTPAERLGS